MTTFNTRVRFISTAASPDPVTVWTTGVDHQDAKVKSVRFVTRSELGQSQKLEDIKIRLYPGGLMAVLLVKAHDCTSCESLRSSLSASIIVYNWHHGKVIGVSVIWGFSHARLTLRL